MNPWIKICPLYIINDQGKLRSKSLSSRRKGSLQDVASKKLELDEVGCERIDPEDKSRKRTTPSLQRRKAGRMNAANRHGLLAVPRRRRPLPAQLQQKPKNPPLPKPTRGRRSWTTLLGDLNGTTYPAVSQEEIYLVTEAPQQEEVGRQVRSYLEDSIANGSNVKLKEPRSKKWYPREK